MFDWDRPFTIITTMEVATTVTWDFDGSEPLITAERTLAYYAELMGCGLDQLALPDLLVATFQQRAMDRLAGRIGAEAPTRWPTPIFWPMARGSFRGKSLAVARLPIGAPAAASALELMIAAGVRTVLLAGSAGSLQPDLPVGSLAVPTDALRHEGTSHHYLPAGEPSRPSSELVDALISAALHLGKPTPALGPTWTTDAPYRECADTVARLRSTGVLTVEMEASALFAVALRRGARVALVAAISDQLGDEWSPGFHTLSYTRALLTAADVALEAAAGLHGSFGM